MAWDNSGGWTPAGRRRRALSSARGAVPWSRLAWAFRWVLVPGIAVALIVAGATGIGPAVAAARGHGTLAIVAP